MSSMSEPDPNDPNDVMYYAPRELRERAKSRAQPVRPPIPQPPSLDVRLKTPVYMRRPLAPEVIHESAGPEHEQRRAALFGVAGRVAAVAAFVTVVALFFILVSPALRQSDASSTSPEITGSIRTPSPQSSHDESGSKSALAEFQGVLASAPVGKAAAPEQSPEMLQQFLRWRQKTNSTETSQ